MNNYYDSDQYRNDCKDGWAHCSSWYDLCDTMMLFTQSMIPINNYSHNLGEWSYETPPYRKMLY